MKVICKYMVFMLFIYNFNIFNIDAEKPFSGTLNKVYVCMYVCMYVSSTYFQLHVRAATFKSFIINKKSQGPSLVSEIPRRCSLRSSMGFCFGRGTTLACFQEVGGLCSLKLAFNMGVIDFARISA